VQLRVRPPEQTAPLVTRPPVKTGHGKWFTSVPLDPDMPVTFDNGLASVYLSPSSLSPVIHFVNPPIGDAIRCMPNIPAGRMVPRPEATTATCQRCLAAQGLIGRHASENPHQ
jgi:hypothetical protein